MNVSSDGGKSEKNSSSDDKSRKAKRKRDV